MKRFYLLLALIAAFTACAGRERRIKSNQEAFDSYPPAVQEAISAGKVEVGFSPEQTLMALGKPDRRYSRKTAASAQEVWAYGRGGSGRTGLGVGLGVFSGGPTIYSGGISVGGGGDAYRQEELSRVVFEGGKVVSVERREE